MLDGFSTGQYGSEMERGYLKFTQPRVLHLDVSFSAPCYPFGVSACLTLEAKSKETVAAVTRTSSRGSSSMNIPTNHTVVAEPIQTEAVSPKPQPEDPAARPPQPPCQGSASLAPGRCVVPFRFNLGGTSTKEGACNDNRVWCISADVCKGTALSCPYSGCLRMDAGPF